jgi:tetratricopeptide (TPR) repeat protein
MRDSKVVHYMQIPLNIKLSASMKTCFIVYSSRESHIDITLDAIETVLESTGKYDIKRLSTHGISGYSQYSQLREFLNACSLAIIILDGFRPNVIFEYGILVGLRKPCIVLLEQNATIDIKSFMKVPTKKTPTIPIDMDKDFSDVKDQMYIKYKYNEPKKLRELLHIELKKIEPIVDEEFMKIVFPEKDYIDKEVKESLVVFSEISNTNRKLTKDDEVKFRVCMHEIEKTSNKYGFKLTLYYYYQKIHILIILEKYEEADKLIEELMIEHTSDTILLSLKSESLNMMGKHDLAIECLNSALKNDEKNEFLWHRKALLLDRLDRKDEAIFCYKKGVDFNDGCSTIHYHYGLLLLDNDKFNDALIQFNKALKIRPTDSKYLVCKAICLSKLDNKVSANKAITDALCFDENNVDAWYQLGKMTDNEIEAIKYFEKCLSFNSRHEGALCSRGATLSNIGRIEEACVDLEKAITSCSIFRDKGCSAIQGNLGRTKYRLFRTGKHEYRGYDLEAMEHFKKAMDGSNDEDKVEFLNNIGYIYLSLNNIPEAKGYFTKACEIPIPSHKTKTVILYNLGLTYLIEGDYIKANELLTNSANLSIKIKPSERDCYCMFIPEVKQSNILLVELNTKPDIYECAKIAISVADSFIRGEMPKDIVI